MILMTVFNGFSSTTYPRWDLYIQCMQCLDMTATKDRLGNWTDYSCRRSLRRKIAETNALGKYTLYTYCLCGMARKRFATTGLPHDQQLRQPGPADQRGLSRWIW